MISQYQEVYLVGGIDSQIVSAGYVAALQDALGNSGASISISGNSNVITRIPNDTSKFQASLNADTISLSVKAQKYLSDANNALGIIQKVLENTTSTNTGDNKLETPTFQSQKSLSQFSKLSIKSDTPQVISGILSASKAQVNDPDYIYSQWNNPNTLEAIKLGLSPDEATSFQKAFDNKTFIVRNTDNIPGFNLVSSTTITGNTESTAAGSYNGQLQQALQRQEGGYAAIVPTTFGGGLYVTWGTDNTTLS